MSSLPVGLFGALAWLSTLYFIDRSVEERDKRLRIRVAMSAAGHLVAYLGFLRFAPETGSNALKLSFNQISVLIAAIINHLWFMVGMDGLVPQRLRPYWRYVWALVDVGIFFWVIGTYVPDDKRAVEISKAAVAILAAAAIFYEQHTKGQQRPISERWKKVVGISLAVAAISLYFNGYKFGYPKYWHRWDQYHYFMGAKYYPELGYKNLYKCAVVAEDELGNVEFKLDRPFGSDVHPSRTVDMRAEMRDPDKKIRDLPGENLLIPVGDILANKQECIDKFTPERWEAYKADVGFFRIVSGKGYWTDMQKDHGFNPPPVWTIAGKFFSDLSAGSVQYNQFLASLDILYIIGVFVALWWGFGWRVMAAGAIFWGTQSSAPFYWTGGAFLRQDWLFFTVLSVACLRRRYFKVAGASVVYAGLLRIFPGLVVVGTLVPTIVYAIKHKRMHKDHLQMLIGGTAAAVVLIGLSIAMTKPPGAPLYEPYQRFYEHTIETHDQTPLTNHMGLRVIIGHKFFDFHKPGLRNAEERKAWVESLPKPIARFVAWTAPVRLPIGLATGPESGQMEYTRDNRLLDPFEVWKRMRVERYEKYKRVAYAIILATLVFFVMAVRRTKSLWIAQCLGQIFIILGSQLTCYYYSFMILGAPLIKVRRQIELGLYALAAVTQIIWMNSYWNDNKYTLLTIVSLIFCYIMIGMFWRRGDEAERVVTPIPDGDPVPEDDQDDTDDEEEQEEDDEDEAGEPAFARS
ncbi:MAG: hypothetical protein KC731_33885 [Myxococcales bacterium]|nr:hypothetical protein [Myxococcales bacterium]